MDAINPPKPAPTKTLQLRATFEVFVPRANDPTTGDVVKAQALVEVGPTTTVEGVLRRMRHAVDDAISTGRSYKPQAIILPDAPKLVS